MYLFYSIVLFVCGLAGLFLFHLDNFKAVTLIGGEGEPGIRIYIWGCALVPLSRPPRPPTHTPPGTPVIFPRGVHASRVPAVQSPVPETNMTYSSVLFYLRIFALIILLCFGFSFACFLQSHSNVINNIKRKRKMAKKIRVFSKLCLF